MTRKLILGTSKITAKCQITIPKAVRNVCEFSEGDLVVFEMDNGRLYIKSNRES